MKSVVVTSFLAVAAIATHAEVAPPDATSARSVSGQFVVHSSMENAIVVLGSNAKSTNRLLSLEPSFAAISCERIKQALLDRLGTSDRWKGKVFIELRPGFAEEPITLACNRFKDRWNYQLYVPNTVEPRRFMHAVVQTILLEIANRNAARRSAEIPAWLTEGLVQQLLESRENELLLSRPHTAVRGVLVTPTVTQKKQTERFEVTYRTLREHPQLTLEQLSWPTDEQLVGKDGGVYRYSAQLFVSELLRLKDGRACMVQMLAELADCYNWQTAFLRAFKPHFSRLLDLEKWWALQVVHIAGRDTTQFWTLEESTRKLDEILLTPAQIRAVSNDLPLSVELKLQTVITEWDFARQRRALREKIQTLGYLHLRLAPELMGLAGEYIEVLDAYLKERAKTTVAFPGVRSLTPTTEGVVKETLKRLDALDERRVALKLQPIQAAAQ
jgi:hypothetical protein